MAVSVLLAEGRHGFFYCPVGCYLINVSTMVPGDFVKDPRPYTWVTTPLLVPYITRKRFSWAGFVPISVAEASLRCDAVTRDERSCLLLVEHIQWIEDISVAL